LTTIFNINESYEAQSGDIEHEDMSLVINQLLWPKRDIPQVHVTIDLVRSSGNLRYYCFCKPLAKQTYHYPNYINNTCTNIMFLGYISNINRYFILILRDNRRYIIKTFSL